MKIKYLPAIAMLTASVIIAGCKTSGYQQADKTGSGIANFRGEIVKCKQAIDGTMTALDQIAQTANTNPRPAFENYSKQVANLEATAERVRKSRDDMKERGQAYFAQWEEQLGQVKDEDVRKLAQQRKAKLQESFDKIREYTEPLKDQFTPWMSSLKDLQSYLANDLTVSGIAAAKKPFAKAKANGKEVQESMDNLIDELNTLAATLTPANVQPVKTNAPAN